VDMGIFNLASRGDRIGLVFILTLTLVLSRFFIRRIDDDADADAVWIWMLLGAKE